MKKLAIMLLTLAAFGILAAGCSDTEKTETLNPDDLKPPLGLVSFSGDQQVTLAWDSANSIEEDKFPPTAFSIYMAAGDYSTSDCVGPINKYQLIEEEANADEGPVCGDLGAKFSQNETLTEDNAIIPVLLDDINDYTVPGPVFRLIENGEAMTDLSAIMEAADAADDDDDDAVADDDDDDAVADDDDDAALVYPSQASSTEPPADEEAGAGQIELANGTTYTFFVTVRTYEDFSGESYTSNWVVETPRKAVDGVTMGVDDCYDLDGLGEAIACSDDDGTADISVTAWGNLATSSRPRILINGINDAQVMDAGAVDSFDDVGEAADQTSGAYLDTDVGVIARPGHVYVIYTNSGYYGKILVSEMSDMVDLVSGTETVCTACSPTAATVLTIQGALQTEGRLMK